MPEPALYVGPLLITCTWDQCGHLDEAQKQKLLEGYPPHQRDARTKGIPQLGAGAVYPLPEEEFVIDDFPLRPEWPRVFSLDVGWNRTATLWAALDRNTNILYVYSEHYQGRMRPKEHADAIRARGIWIPGVVDPASAGSSQHDGRRIIDLYRQEGLDLTEADNDVEAGIYDVWQRLQAGTLKVFRSLMNFRQEYRLYRRDAKGTGKIVKPNLPAEIPEGKTAAQFGDHLMDCLRYLCRSGIALMKTEPPKRRMVPLDPDEFRPPRGPNSWMG